jgi:Protein of unknown function (DUF2848)
MGFSPELSLTVEEHAGRTPLAFTVRHIVCAGYTSRDRAEAERHIQELQSLGIARPQEVPVFFAVASYLATAAQVIEVQGPFTSGEAEFALILGPGGPWVTVASDQTDRFVERHSVPAAKQLCPKVLGPTVWPLAEVAGHWDDLELRAWVRSGRKRRLYQEAKLGSLLGPETLLAGLRRRVGRALDGVVLLSGTVPTVEGQLVYGDAYELELGDPHLGRVIRTQYAVRVLEPGPRR